MSGPSERKREPTKHPLSPLPDPEEGVNPRLPDSEPPADENRADDEREESEEEKQARESEKAFDQAATRIPPG